MRAPAPGMRKQGGVAIITALLLTTLAVTIVASLFWQQQVQVRSMENQRLHLQTKWILRGALDLSRLILRQDAMGRGRNVTTLDAAWATPLEETRLDQYVERERLDTDSFDATLSGRIIDAQSRYNLASLAKGRVVKPEQVEVYRRLLRNLNLDPSLAQATADAMAKSQISTINPTASAQSGSEPMELVKLDDVLSIPGYTAQTLARLREFAIVLPMETDVNVNTASPEVLAAVVDFSVQEAAALVERRKRASYNDVPSFKALLAQDGKALVRDVNVAVRSTYFLAYSKVRLDRAALDAEALIWRQLTGSFTTEVLWIRQN
jgi:general secretion pathway protein K